MSAGASDSHEEWGHNYFNYFTETEEHFQQARGSGLFLLSPVDWALIEAWKNAGVPLEAVLRGIDQAFEKWRASKRSKLQSINSLTYCAQAVMAEAQAMASAGVGGSEEPAVAAAPFTLEELEAYLGRNIRALQEAGYMEAAAALGGLRDGASGYYARLEELEQRLTAIEEKMTALARTRQSEEDGFADRRDLDLQLRPYRSRMTAEQLAMLEKQFLERRLLERAKLPRLSLFYLR